MTRWLLIMILTLEGAGMSQDFHRCGPNEPWTNCLDRWDLKITDPNEYAAYLNAESQKDDIATAGALEAFLEQYPESPVKVPDLEHLMAAYEKQANVSRATETAERLLQADVNNLRALAFMAQLKRHEAESKTPNQMQKPLAEAVQYAQRGLPVLPNKTNEAVQKSRRDSLERLRQQGKQEQNEAELEKLASDTKAIFNGIIGYAALYAKDYPSAQQHLQEAVDANPANLEDIYPLAHAYLKGWPSAAPGQTAPPVTASKGIWYLARTASVVQDAQVKASTLKSAHSLYVKLHGSDGGWDELTRQVAKENIPPADFAITPRRSPADEAGRMAEERAHHDSQAMGSSPVRANGTLLPLNMAYAVPKSGPATPSTSVSSSAKTHAWRQVYTIPAGAVASRSSDGSAVLTTEGSRAVLRQINTTRSALKGVNSRPFPAGQITAHTYGSLTISASGGREFDVRPDGTIATFRGKDSAATFDRGGRITSLHTGKLELRNGVNGRRTVVIHGPGNSVTVSHGRHNGYVQREVTIGGQKAIQRTYEVNGVKTTRFYRNYMYHGATLPLFMPKTKYTPVFYGWAYYPWATPVTYSWPSAKTPPHGIQSGGHSIYFLPWPAYSGATSWLTDYYLYQVIQDSSNQSAIADDIQAPGESYVPASDNSPAEDSNGVAVTAISPDLKQVIADEVQQQLTQENAAGENPSQVEDINGLRREMQPGHVFVADEELNLVTADLQICQLSPGAVLTLVGPHDDGVSSAELTVTSSRAGECSAGTKVVVSLEDLQEMQNSFRAGLDSGLQTLRDEQGRNGLPPAPESAILPPPLPAEDEPPAQSDVDELLGSAERDANKAEGSLTASAFAPALR